MTAAELRWITLGGSVTALSQVVATCLMPDGTVVPMDLEGHYATVETIERGGQKVPAGVATLHLEYKAKG